MTQPVRQNGRWWQRLLRDAAGAEIAEAAVVMPLLFMLLFGIMWFARAFNIYATVNRAVREGALVAAARDCATCTNTFHSLAYIQNSVVNPILIANHLDPGQVQNFSVQWNQPLNPSSPLVEQGTIVSFDYPYNFKLNGITCCPLMVAPITTGVTIRAQAQARQED